MSLLFIFMNVRISGSAGNHDWTLVGRDICATDGDAGKKLTAMASSAIFLLVKKWEKFSGMKNESKWEVEL
jgi:hypothetical protein